jgi:hypothetical protein
MQRTATPHKFQDTPLSLGKDIYRALTQVDLQRVHTTITIGDFDYITQDTRYIFYNNGPKKMSVLLLPAIKRKDQRNMKVEDFRTRKLVFIPSSSSADILVEASTKILNNAKNKLPKKSQRFIFKGIMKNIQSKIPEVFKYRPEQSSIEFVCNQINNIRGKTHFWTDDFLRDILLLANPLFEYKKGLYHPLITLAKPFPPKTYTLIHFSVEKLREYLQDWKERFKFNFFGKFPFAFEPEIHRGISNHIRIYAPDGLSIKDIEFDFKSKNNSEDQSESEDIPYRKLEKDLNENKKDYFDDRCFYIQLGPKDSTTLYRCKKYFNITFGLSNLLKTLSWLWWLTALSPLVCGVLFKPGILPSVVAQTILSSEFAFVLLALSATFIVAVGIYAIDKKIVKHFITLHIILIYMVLAIEIFFMIYYN